MSELSLIVTCARGTEKALRHELTALGLEGRGTGKGAVEISAAAPEAVARLNLESRVGLRVLWVLGRFHAETEAALVEQLSALRFEQQLDARTTFAVQAHLEQAPWTHTRYAAQRVKDVIVDRLRALGRTRPSVDTRSPDVRYVLHWERASATLALDTSGTSLDRRGYRQRDAVAPMRETLGAAILAIGHADVQRPFLDPCCGSGTLAIEQAWRALDRAPNLGRRRFAFERWPFVDAAWLSALRAARDRARERERAAPPAVVRLSDYHAGAVELARAQVNAAGVASWLQPTRSDARRVELPEGGVVVANLPFGERLGGANRLQLDGFYRTFGAHLARGQRLRVLLFTAHPRAEELLQLGPARRTRLSSGGLDARLLRWDL